MKLAQKNANEDIRVIFNRQLHTFFAVEEFV